MYFKNQALEIMFYFKVVECLHLNSNLFFGRGMQDLSSLSRD